MNRISFFCFLIAALIVACATPEHIVKKAEVGRELIIEKSTDQVFPVVVQIIMSDGFTLKTINEKYGILVTEPNTMRTGQLMTKLGEGAGGIVAMNPSLNSEINLACTILPIDAKRSKINIKASVFSVETPFYNPFSLKQAPQGTSRQFDEYRSASVTDYYFNKIGNALEKK